MSAPLVGASLLSLSLIVSGCDSSKKAARTTGARDPSAFGDDLMPKFAALGVRRLREVAIFLAASKGMG